MFKYVLIITGLILMFVSSVALTQVEAEEPIAYIGHGGFFDGDGNQIELTLDFVEKAQEWYRTKLLSTLSDDKQAEFAKIEESLNASINADGQARLVVQQYLLKWLAANSDMSTDGRTFGKLDALQYALNWHIPDRAGRQDFSYGQEFKLDPEIEQALDSLDFTSDESSKLRAATATTNRGQAYLTECSNAGVPIPPAIGQLDPAGLTGWKSQGFIPPNDQFIENTPAEVRTFQSSSPAGMCFALPRYTNNALTTVMLDGVICLGQTTSKVCFWDNQMDDGDPLTRNGFEFPAGAVIPIGVPSTPGGLYQAGGAELEFGSGGVCTDCHAGQNPFIIHPNVNLATATPGAPPVFMGSLSTFSGSRYDPLVGASWPQNQLSHSPVLVPTACVGCHVTGGSGGAFPHLSTELNGAYCGTVLNQAINETMPQGNPGSEASSPAVATFQAWCATPASAGPSDRGDPHLATTNDIHYDFQAAGEFVALRNSATFFELQTRQTPVSTTFMPGANPYTGLASCVSLNTAAALRVSKYRITYQPPGDQLLNKEGLELRIDGELVSLSREGIDLGYGNWITSADSEGGLQVHLSDGTQVIITSNFWESQGYWYLNIEVLNSPAREGTMGTILGGDWLPLAPDGSSFGPAPASLIDRHVLLNIKFADAWRVTDTTSLFDYAPGTSTDTFTDRQWPPEPGQPCIPTSTTNPPAEPMEPEKAMSLCSEIKDEAAYADCVFDLTATGDEGMARAYIRTLQLRENALAGIP